jgi:uncharacterized membrane protein
VEAAYYRQVNLSVYCPPNAPPGNFSVLNVSAHPDATGTRKSFLEFTTVAGFVRVSKLPSEPAEKIAIPTLGQNGPTSASFTVSLSNLVNFTGQSVTNMSVSVSNISDGPGWSAYPDENFTIEVPYGNPVTFDFSVWPPDGAGLGQKAVYNITAADASNSSRTSSLLLTVTMGQEYRVNASANITELTMMRGENASVGILLNNTGNGPDLFGHTAQASTGLLVDFPAENVAIGSHNETVINITVYAASDAEPGLLSVQVSFYSVDYPSAKATVILNVNVS